MNDCRAENCNYKRTQNEMMHKHKAGTVPHKQANVLHDPDKQREYHNAEQVLRLVGSCLWQELGKACVADRALSPIQSSRLVGCSPQLYVAYPYGVRQAKDKPFPRQKPSMEACYWCGPEVSTLSRCSAQTHAHQHTHTQTPTRQTKKIRISKDQSNRWLARTSLCKQASKCKHHKQYTANWAEFSIVL